MGGFSLHTGSNTHQRALSIAVACLFLTTLLPVTSANHAWGLDHPAYFDDFNSWPLNYEVDHCYAWSCSDWVDYPNYAPSRYRFAADGSDRVVANLANYGASDSTVYYTPAAHDGYLTTSTAGSFHIRMKSSENDTRSAAFYLTDSAKIASAGNIPYYFQSMVYVELGTLGNMWARSSGGSRLLGEYSPDEWVTIDVDFGGGKYDVCVNGNPVQFDIPYYSNPTGAIDTVALFASGSVARDADARWDDVVFVPEDQNFCLDTIPEEGTQDFWNFSGVGDMYSDDQIHSAAVDAFMDCTKEVNAQGLFRYPYHGCPYTVAELEAMIREKIEDGNAEQNSVLPDVVRPTNEAPAMIPRPATFQDTLDGVDVPTLTPVDGPAMPYKSVPEPVAGPDLPPVPEVRFLKGPDFEMPDRPGIKAEPVIITAPEVPATESVVIPLRDHDFTMNWTVSMTLEKFLEMLTPVVPTTPSVQSQTGPTVGSLMPETSAGAQGTGQFTPNQLTILDHVAREAGIQPLSERDPTTFTVSPDAEAAPPLDSDAYAVWVQERNDLINYLEEAYNIPDYRDALALPPLVFEIHTESRGQVKRTTALPLVPVLINVDNNPSTGLLGFDIAARISFTPLLNSLSLNITRLAPWERNAPDMWEPVPKEFETPDGDTIPDILALPPGPIQDALDQLRATDVPDVTVNDPYPDGILPGSPLDLTAYAIVPIPMPWPVETMLTKNPDQIMVAAVGFDTNGNDAAVSSELTLAADSLLPLHPNSRITLTLDTQDALDNFTLLGGVADAVRTGPDESDSTTTLEDAYYDADATLRNAVPSPYDRLIPKPADPSLALGEEGDILIDSTAYRTGYTYEANNATLVSVSFQPPPDTFEVDVSLATNPDANDVVRFTGDADSDIRVVITTETDLLSNPVRDAVNLRADKFPQSVTITAHQDPYLPALDVDYQADHAIGRLHVVSGQHVVFPDDDPAKWAPGSAPILYEGGKGTANDVFHLNVSDLPANLDIRTEGGDIRLEAGQPIGRVALVAASNRAPALLKDEDGLLFETDDSSSRIGFVLRGIESFAAITSEDVKTVRWEMTGDRPFLVNMSLGDDITGQDVRVAVSNLPQELMFATDASSMALLKTSDAIRELDAYFIHHGLDVEARLGIKDIPESLDARFNFTSGDLSMTGANPIGEVAAIARLGAAPGGIGAIRVLIEDLPSFKVAWALDGSDVDVAFDAGGNGIGLLQFHAGDDVFLTVPDFAGVDHAYLLEGAHPGAPLAIGTRITGLKHVSAHITPDSYGFRAEHKLPHDLALLVDTPALFALGLVEPVPSIVSVDVDLGGTDVRAVYEASQVIDRIAMWVRHGTLEGHVDVRSIPERIDFSLEDDGAGGMRGDIRNQGILGSIEAHIRDPAQFLGTPWTRMYARLESLPEETMFRVREGTVIFDSGPGSIGLVEAAVTNGPALLMLPGDHAYLRGDAAGDTVEASVRITDLSHVEAVFTDELRLRVENDRPRPFTGHVVYPHMDVIGTVRVKDLPAVITVTSNLVDTHLYEASSIIDAIDVYGKVGTLQGWVHLDDVPARVNVIMDTTPDGMEGYVLSSTRMQEIRADIFDPTGIVGTDWQRAFVRVVGIPEVLGFTVTATGAEFTTEHAMIALIEGAASTTPDLTFLEGDHIRYEDTFGKGCESSSTGGNGDERCTQQDLSFRLHGLEGARATFKENDLRARLETKDSRPFLAYVNTPQVWACLLVDPLPTVIDFKSDMASEHVYDATSVIDKLELSAYSNGTGIYARFLDIPKHMHIQHNNTDDGGEVRIWMDTILRDILVDVQAYGGLMGTEWKRARFHVENLPRELKFSFDETGAEFGTGWDEIGLVEAWASMSFGLKELVGDHAMYAMICAEPVIGETDPSENGGAKEKWIAKPCDGYVSARLTGLSGGAFRMTPEAGLSARFETRDARTFSALYADLSVERQMGAHVIIDALPATISIRSDLENRFIYDASSSIDSITALAYLMDATQELTLKARLENLPARIEVTQDFGPTGGEAQFIASSNLGLIEMELTDGKGLGDTDFTTLIARIQDLPSVIDVEYVTIGDRMDLVIGTDGQGVGLMEAGLSTSSYIPITYGNGAIVTDTVWTTTAAARIRGFTGIAIHSIDGAVSAELTMQDKRPFEAIATVGDTHAYLLIDSVPASLSVSASVPDSIVYSASSPIEKIIAYVEQDTPAGDRILRADVTVIPKDWRFTMDVDEGVAHFDASEAIGSVTLQIRDPEETTGFHNVYAKISHLPPQMRATWKDTFQIDLGEGVDSLVFKATGLGVYPTYAGPHASIRMGVDLAGEDRMALSVRVNALKFAEVKSGDSYTMAEVRFRQSQDLKVHYEEVDAFGVPSVQHNAAITNIPKDLKIQIIQGLKGTTGSLLYDASERVGGLDYAMIKSADDYLDLSFANLPSDLDIDWRFGTNIPWYIRYVSDAPTEVDFNMPTSLGPLGVEALVQNFQWSILKVPSLIPDVSLDVSFSLFPVPKIDINLQLKWTFVLGTDTDFLPNNVKVTLGLFHSDDFYLALTLTGDLLAQDWLYEASLVVNIGTSPGVKFEIDTVGGMAFAELCVGVEAYYSPLGFGYNNPCVKQIGGTYP